MLLPAASIADMLGAISFLGLRFSSDFPNTAVLVPRNELGSYDTDLADYPLRSERDTQQVRYECDALTCIPAATSHAIVWCHFVNSMLRL